MPRNYLYLVQFLLVIAPSQQLNIEFCQDELGGALADDAFTASSSYDPLNVGPQNARLNSDTQGGAWCPREPVSLEKEDQYLEVNLGATHVIAEILTQGRFANGQGQEYTQAYRLHYWRQGLAEFKEYRDSMGKTILPGNKDTYTVASNPLSPPIVASKLRVLPHSNHSRTVCLRLALRGCLFTEGVISYNIPQGMVRGSTLELLDITYDGMEDQITGHLRGGLGQLVDGKYGANNFKAPGDNGIVRGYEWVGWKNRSLGPLQLDFTFDTVRLFSKMAIHINNHYTRDIQIFARAKVYFSNEEGKFGDDRAVDFLYMPDTMIEEARNVTINLHGEHGRYVMVHLFFASKWILISEVTFWSEVYREQPFLVKPPDDEAPQEASATSKIPVVVNLNLNSGSNGLVVATDNKKENAGGGGGGLESVLEDPDAEANYVGLIIGVLLTLISLLVAGIFWVVFRGGGVAGSTVRGKETPTTQSLIASKIQDRLAASIDFKDLTASYTPYKAKMRVYGHVPAHHEEDDGNLYSHPILPPSAHAPPPNRSFVSLGGGGDAGALSEDCTDDYAEPQQLSSQLFGSGQLPTATAESTYRAVNSTSYLENIYAQALPPSSAVGIIVNGTSGRNNSALKSAAASSIVNHYERPQLALPPPPRTAPDDSSQPFLLGYSPPRRFSPPSPLASRRHKRLSPPRTLNLQSIYGTSSRRTKATILPPPAAVYSSSQPEIYSPVPLAQEAGGSLISPSQSSLSSSIGERFYARPDQPASVAAPLYSRVSKMRTSSPAAATTVATGIVGTGRARSHSASHTDHNKNVSEAALALLAEPVRIQRSQLRILERLGRGQYGDVHICHYLDSPSSSLVAVKSLESNAARVLRLSFETEARILAAIRDPNIAGLVGANIDSEPPFMACEYSDRGDLNQYLQDHVAETSLSKSPGVATLSFGALMYMATQISSGMKYLESINFIHRDLATRNCLVFPKYVVKISDSGSVRTAYSSDYYTTVEGSRLPIRWMAWEPLVLGKYTTKSDVWSFGVTFWEILTFAREQPYEALSEDKVLENISALYQTGRLAHTLPQPYNCPRDIYRLIAECWHKVESERPTFREIHLFLQRKNLGFSPKEE